MARLLDYAIELMKKSTDLNNNPLQNPDLNPTQNPELSNIQNPEIAESQNPDINPTQNQYHWKNAQWKLLEKYLINNLTDKQIEMCKNYLKSQN